MWNLKYEMFPGKYRATSQNWDIFQNEQTLKNAWYNFGIVIRFEQQSS